MKKVLFITFIFTITIININALTESVIDITSYTIFELQEAVDNGLIDYETITKIYLERINEYDKNYKAIISINENAIKEAKKCDEIYKKSGRKSILFGMPIIVKDNIDVYVLPTTAGAKSLSDNYPNSNSKVIENLIDKGAIILAKANMSEFAFMASSSVSSYGTVKNAYNNLYSSYGSSGGSAVSVALSFAPLALGTDTNTSVRAPASANNLYGIRPTFGLISNDGILPYDITRDTVGAITKTAKDNAIMLAVMSHENENKYINENASLEGKKIGILREFVEGNSSGLVGSNEEIKELFYKTVNLLKDNGAEIIEIKNFYTSSFNAISNSTMAGWTMCYGFNNYIKNTTGTIKSFQKLSSSNGHIYSLTAYVKNCNDEVNSTILDKYDEKKSSYREALEKLFKDNDLDAVMYPTMNEKLSKIGSSNISSNASNIAPVLGVPSITIPMGEIDGLYYGYDLLTLKNKESILYDISISYNEINNTYILPKEVPNLYEIPNDVTNLVNMYLKNKDNSYKYVINRKLKDSYKDINKNIRDFFKNYNKIEDKQDKAKTLLNDYTDILNNLSKYDLFYIENHISILLGIFVFILLLLPKKIFKRV